MVIIIGLFFEGSIYSNIFEQRIYNYDHSGAEKYIYRDL